MVFSPEQPEKAAKGKGLQLEQPPLAMWKTTRAQELHFKTWRQPDNLITCMARLACGYVTRSAQQRPHGPQSVFSSHHPLECPRSAGLAGPSKPVPIMSEKGGPTPAPRGGSGASAPRPLSGWGIGCGPFALRIVNKTRTFCSLSFTVLCLLVPLLNHWCFFL